jgi:predicted dehydrogenase
MKRSAAVVGLRFVGKAHFKALRRVGIELRGALGSSPESAAAACKDLGLPRTYASIDELAEVAAVDVVHLCAPNHLHFSHASRLLRAGKHALCEKPLALDSRESEILVNLAKETGRVGGIAYNLRYYPLCQEARVLIQKGVIGEPHLIHTQVRH